MTNLSVGYNHYERDGEDVPTLVISGLRLRGDECAHFYEWLRSQRMGRRADIVLIALTRAVDGQQGSISKSRNGVSDEEMKAREHTARKIAERYGESDIEIVR